MVRCTAVTRYELLDRIGVGGMAEIFRGKAVAAGGFEKPVAIKRILPHLSQDKRFVELLIAEAKVLSLLKHRNIVQIFDVGLGDDNQYFLVMEYVDGKDLGAVQRGLEASRRRIPFDLALHVGAEICEALEHAHSAKAPDGRPMSLVHRDVSPSNVLLSRAGEIKLTDFGIAKRAEAEHTSSGAVRGKFAYISPEQARNQRVEPRSDVWSVGVVLWELVTGQRLFSGLGDVEALRAVREAQVRRPREADSRLTAEFEALLMRALARDPRQRPTSAEFGSQLRTLRYALDVTVGDPATELAKIIDTAEQALRESETMAAQRISTAFAHADPNEATVVHVRTADAFSARTQDGQDVSAARQVIHRFQEEETRLAQLSGAQVRDLRDRRDSGEMTTAEPPPEPPDLQRAQRPRAAQTVLQMQDDGDDDSATVAGDIPQYDPEATRLVTSSSRRTPPPERIAPRASATSPTADRDAGATTAPPPGTVQHPRADLAPRTPPPGTGQHPLPDLAPRTPHGSAQHPRRDAPPPPPRPLPPAPAPPPPAPPPPPPRYPMMPPPPPRYPMMPPPGYPPPPAPGMPYPGTSGPHAWSEPLPHGYGPPPTHDPYGRPLMHRDSMPHMDGPPPRRVGLQPWMLVVGALIMAGLAFAITRALIGV